jgi:hypothetical protein
MVERAGIVAQRTVAAGSKSEHLAVVLLSGADTFVLRRAGGNPFRDPELDRLVGQHLRCHGTIHGSTFILSDWHVVGDEG